MRNIHQHSLFPVAVLLLTAGLGVFIYFTVTSTPETTGGTSTNVEEVVPVDEGEYTQGMQTILDEFLEKVESSTDGLDTLIAAESAQFSMLSIRVPAEYRSTHLQIALALTDIQLELKAEERDVDPLIEALRVLMEETTWLSL
jgi:hypothetical protein